MCNKTNYKIPNPRIDKCMMEEVKGWKDAIKLLSPYMDLKIMASCCGHGKYPKTIVLREGTNTKDMNPMYFEHFSGTGIPRTRNFYKRDKQRYYYIPEVVKNDK